MTERSVDILICTFRRPDVTRTLDSLAACTPPPDTRLRIIVVDNDDTPSARAVIEGAAAGHPLPVSYFHAPRRNISIARNACLDAADADWIALLDDDEYIETGWLVALLETAERAQVDGVFGPVLADYPLGTPNWIRARDYHSSRPQRRRGRVETGLTGNALLRWRNTPWQAERFDIARGRSGGEDTEFFFRLGRAGARFEICDAAIVREAVPEDRLSFDWLRRRRFRMGQSYVSSAPTLTSRLALGGKALAKTALCGGMALACVANREWRNYWLLRGAMHAGICAGCIALPEAEHYGAASDPSR